MFLEILGHKYTINTLKKQLKKQFDYLQDLVSQTDPSFQGAVAAQQAKQFKGIDHLEKRLLNAQKRVLKDEVERLVLIHEQLFPNDNLQERTLNFTSFFLELGSDFIPQLIDSLDPLNPNFVLLDLHLPEVSGDVIIDSLKAKLADIRFIHDHDTAIIQINRLAMVSGVGSKWSVLRVIEAGDGYSILEPLSRQRKSADLNGKLATFLEIN